MNQVILSIAFLLSISSIYRVIVTLRYLWHRKKIVTCYPSSVWDIEDYPLVTIQLPIYNEPKVVDTLLNAISKIEYPRDKLEIQVLDDSTDFQVVNLVASKVNELRNQGIDCKLIHRDSRSGYKAGALAHGLKDAKGEFIAIFDADFIVESQFLKTVIPYFIHNKTVGMVQTKWSSVSKDLNKSLLITIQEIMMDNYFNIEQFGKNFAHLPLNFSGTCGVWRKKCIEDAGGWQSDTVTEDLDISYRAQLKGWRFNYLPVERAVSQLPTSWRIFRRQQRRWMQGTIQVLCKLFSKIIRGSISLRSKAEMMMHLLMCSFHNLFITLLMVMGVLICIKVNIVFGAWFLLVNLGIFYLYFLLVTRSLIKPFLYLLVSCFLSQDNLYALIQALKGDRHFHRTPKYKINA